MGAEVLRKPWLGATAALLLSSASAFSACPVPTITGSNVRGRAHDLLGSQQRPVTGVTVRLLNDSGRVVAQVLGGQDGHFSISAPERGRYRLTVMADGFLEVSAVVVVKKLGKDAPFIRVGLGSDATRPCGGGGITVEMGHTGPLSR